MELEEEFGDELLNIAMIDEDDDSDPMKYIEELELLLAKDPFSSSAEVKGVP